MEFRSFSTYNGSTGIGKLNLRPLDQRLIIKSDFQVNQQMTWILFSIDSRSMAEIVIKNHLKGVNTFPIFVFFSLLSITLLEERYSHDHYVLNFTYILREMNNFVIHINKETLKHFLRKTRFLLRELHNVKSYDT